AQIAELRLEEAQALADGDGVRGDLALMVLAIVIARDDRGHERGDRRQVRVIQLAVEADRADRGRADPREDADELALLVGERVRLAPGDEKDADGLVGGAQRVEEQGFVPEALEQLLRRLGRLRASGERDRLAGFEGAAHEAPVLRQGEDVARRGAGREGELERIAALVEVDRGDRRLQQIDDGFREKPRDVGELRPLRDRETDAVKVEEAPRQGRGALVQVRALDRDRSLVRDRHEEPEVTLLVRGEAPALRRDRADHLVPLAERRDDDRVLLDGAPRLEIGEPELLHVPVDVPQEERPALDRGADEGAAHRALDRLELSAAVDEEAVADGGTVGTERRDEEVVRVHDRRDLAVDAAEDLVRIERAPHRVAHLDERGEEARAPLGDEARADLEVAEHEERNARDEEPRLDDDDLDRDDRGEAPEELRPRRPPEPAHGLAPEPFRAEDELEREDLTEVENHEGQRREGARDDDLPDRRDDPIEHRLQGHLEDHRRRARADRLGGGVADDAHERFARRDVDDESGRRGDERELSRREDHDPGEDRHLRCRELDVRRDADRTERQQHRERPDVEGDWVGRFAAEDVLKTERDERRRDQAGDRHEYVRARGDRSHPMPSCVENEPTPGPMTGGVSSLSGPISTKRVP